MKNQYKLFDTRQISELGQAVLGFVLIFISIFIFGLGAYMQLTPLEKIDITRIKLENEKKCSNILKSQGYQVDMQPNIINIKSYDLVNHKDAFFGLENSIARCDGYVLQKMCYGLSPHCEEQGLTAVIKYYDPIKYID